MPPRYSSDKWIPPTSLKDYYGQIKDVLLLAVIVVAWVIVTDLLSNIRTFLDRHLGYKKIGVFEVVTVWNLLTRKIVFLNNLRFFILNQKDYGFDEIDVGQVLEIERTATHRFIDYQILKK